MDNVEKLGIALLPDENVKREALRLKDAIQKKLLGGKALLINTPHISIFQMTAMREDCEKIWSEVNIFNFGDFSFDMELLPEYVGDNIFWNAIFSEYFEKLCERIIKKIKNYRSYIFLDQVQDREGNLTEMELTLLKEYGIFWGIPYNNFNPHITLLYDVGHYRDKTLNFMTTLSKRFLI